MNNIKNISHIVFCFVLILTMVFSMASCDIKGTFQNLGEGDFKGAWNSMIGKGDNDSDVHDHSYSAVVTAPDCVNAGYTTYTCECGDYYVGDKVSALGHDYKEKVTRFPTPYTKGVISKMCATCGACVDTYIDTVTFALPEVSDYIKSLVGTNSFVISAKDSEITLIKEIETESDISYNKDFFAINLGYIEINGEGEELYAYFSCDLGVARYVGPDADAIPAFDGKTTITVIVNGENVSIAVTEDGDFGEADYNMSDIFYGAMASCFGMSYEQFKELTYVHGKVNECLPFVESIVETVVTLGSDKVDPILPAIISLVGENVVFKQGDKYYLNFAGFANIISTLQGKKLNELVDERYGKGTFDRVENFLVSLPTMKVRDVVDLAVEISERSDVSLDDIYALVNFYVYTMSGKDFNIESEMLTRYNMTIVGILLESYDYTDKEISERIEEMASKIQSLFDTVRDLDIDQIYNLMKYGDANYGMSYGGSIYRISDDIADLIKAYSEMVTAEITVDESGIVKFIEVNIENVIYLAAGTYDTGKIFTFKLYEAEGEECRCTQFLVNIGENDAMLLYSVNSNVLFSIYSYKNDYGEIDRVEIIANQLITISGQIPDPEDPDGYIWDVHEEIETIIKIKYTNDGDSVKFDVQTADANYNISVTVSVTENYEQRKVQGWLKGEKDGQYRIAEGGFTYIERLDGSGCEFEFNIDEIAYDFTEVYDGDESIVVYDYENPKRYDVLGIIFTSDAEGNCMLDIKTNRVVYDEGVSSLGSLLEVEVSLSTCGVKIEVYEDEELNILAEIEVIETENGVNYKLNLEGLEYTHYEYEYVDNSIEYDGSPVTIVFYHTMGYSNQSILDEHIEKFNEIYPNITIVHQQIGSYDDVRDRTQSDLIYGNQPNIVYCYADHVALYNATGKVVALDEFINDSSMGLTEEELSNFIDGFYEEGATFDEEGTMYMLPMSKSTEVLYYNKTFFEQYGLAVPTTWEEVEEVCEMIKEIDPYSIPFGYDSSANWFITMCAQYGSDYTSLGDDKFLFDNETNRDFVKMFREWYDKGYLITQDIYGTYLSTPFTLGQCYMYIGSSAGARHNTSGDFELGVAPIPQVDPMNPKSIMQGPSLCIFDQENKQEVAASWLFMKFLTTDPEFQADFSMVSGYMPVIEYDAIVDAVTVYESWLHYSDSVVTEALMVAFEQQDAFFVSPAFIGSSAARDQVVQLMTYCLVTPTTDIDAMIEQAFKMAIEECIYYIS